jgi:hypothetical protein
MINQEAVEAEEFHFLGRFDAGGGLPNIVKFAPLWRAYEIERIALRIEMRLSEERWNQSGQQQGDEPGRIELATVTMSCT